MPISEETRASNFAPAYPPGSPHAFRAFLLIGSLLAALNGLKALF
jgi:hypothetical protein